MPCPGGISVGIRSSFRWLYWSSSQLLHAFVVSSMSWYKPSLVEVLALSLILLVTLCGLWSLAKIYFCRVVGMIIRWALVNIPSSLAIWSLKGQFGFKSVGCCWMWLSQPLLIISFNAPSFASKLLCSLIFCNTLLQAKERPREFGRSFRGWVHDSLLIMLTGHQLLQCLCLVGYTNGGIIWLQPWQRPLRTRKRSCQVFKT